MQFFDPTKLRVFGTFPSFPPFFLSEGEGRRSTFLGFLTKVKCDRRGSGS
ncbi:hypothetical protein EVA_05476 [gut metagenome]|uniref:Uncharacterized protein n=1 Tax=gut metagenome TaxID=749906 RepID=J9GUD9_9ZZZZ